MNAYIVSGYRSAVGKAPRGLFRFTRPDQLAAAVIKRILKDHPDLDVNTIDDVIVGNATPEAEQGLNVARMISLMGLDTEKVPGMTVNRYCSSGLETIAIASAKVHAGMADCIIAGGVECMSPIPFGGWRIVPNAQVSKDNPDWYWGMGLTAEAVARDFKVSREDQDEFSYHSNRKAVEAIDAGKFKGEIAGITVEEIFLKDNKRESRSIKVILKPNISSPKSCGMVSGKFTVTTGIGIFVWNWVIRVISYTSSIPVGTTSHENVTA